MQTETTLALDHYHRVGALIDHHLGGVPLVTARFDRDGRPFYAASLHGPPPGHEPTVDVPSDGGWVQYLALHETSILYEAHRYAIEVHSWSPRADDPTRAAFARLLIRPDSDRAPTWTTAALRAIRTELQRQSLDGIAMRDGATHAVVWIPFADGPAYPDVRLWLHALVAALAQTNAPIRPHELHVPANAVGHWSAVPYSLVGPDAAHVVTPLRWDELEAIPAACSPQTIIARLSDDVFGVERRRIGEQHFARGPALLVSGEGHGHILAAIRTILADGRAHSAEEICATAIAQQLVPPTTIAAYIQHAIATLLDRQRDRGEKPEFVQLPDGTYRENVPQNPFAGYPEPSRDRTALDALIAKLHATATRETPSDPADGSNIGAPFERAVAEAFATLGLTTQRLGGEGEPDVVSTAPLGALRYRVAVECKTIAAVKLATSPAFVAEAARLRDAIAAQYAILLALDFPDERGLDAELATHKVALWSLDDLTALLECQHNHPIMWSSLRALLTPGRKADAIVAFRAEHLHGPHQRAQIALRYALEEGLTYQQSLDSADPETLTPGLSIDALTVLVNQRLQREGDEARMSINDIRTAMTLATSHLIEAASYTTPGESILIEHALRRTDSR